MSKYRIVKNEIEGEDTYYTIEKKFLLWWLRCAINFGVCARKVWDSVHEPMPKDLLILKSFFVEYATEEEAKIQLNILLNPFYEIYKNRVIMSVLDKWTKKEIFFNLNSSEYLYERDYTKGYKYSDTFEGIKKLIDDNESKLIKKTIVN